MRLDKEGLAGGDAEWGWVPTESRIICRSSSHSGKTKANPQNQLPNGCAAQHKGGENF